MKKVIATCVISLFSTPLFAMFCPSGFNVINVGDTMDYVIKQCGNPDAKKVTKTVPQKPQEWNYIIKPDPMQPGTLKMSIAFDKDEKVVNISVNGTSLTATTICGGQNIQYGNTTDDIKKACGEPAYKNQEPVTPPSPETAAQPTTDIAELTYNTTPPITLVFENGKLKETK